MPQIQKAQLDGSPVASMTAREAAAFNAGVEAVRQMAMAAAVTMESRDDATDVRKQAAVAALSALADGAKSLLIGKSETVSHSHPGS